MSNYQTIRELVIDSYLTEGGMPSYDVLTEKVLKNFPSSRWQQSHYAWYKSQIRTGRIQVTDTNSEDITDAVIEDSISQSIDTQVSLERDLQQYLALRVGEIEEGLKLVEGGIEYRTEAGRIDLLTVDVNNNLVVIELKAVKAKDSALGQLLGYVGCLSTEHENVRGILVAADFDNRVVFAAKALPNIKLVKYELSFTLDEIDCAEKSPPEGYRPHGDLYLGTKLMFESYCEGGLWQIWRIDIGRQLNKYVFVYDNDTAGDSTEYPTTHNSSAPLNGQSPILDDLDAILKFADNACGVNWRDTRLGYVHPIISEYLR
ncbi:MAG: endonuclease NucS domain-containing protein [Pseudomonadales bacterium]